jgi:hypothetical protein
VKTQAAEAKKQMDALMLGDGNARIEERKRKDDAKRKLAEKQALKDAGLSSDSEDDDEDDGPVYKPDWWEDGMSLEEEVEAEVRCSITRTHKSGSTATSHDCSLSSPLFLAASPSPPLPSFVRLYSVRHCLLAAPW